MREGMVFYRSWFQALEDVPAEEFKTAVMAMARYGLNDEEPDLDGIARLIFTMAKPTIDRRKADAQNGVKGGRPPKNGEHKKGGFEKEKGGFLKTKSTETETETETDTDITRARIRKRKIQFNEFHQRNNDYESIQKALITKQVQGGGSHAGMGQVVL